MNRKFEDVWDDIAFNILFVTQFLSTSIAVILKGSENPFLKGFE